MLARNMTDAKKNGGAPVMFEQLKKSLESNKEELTRRVKGVVLCNIDGAQWTIDLRVDHGDVYEGAPKDCSPDLTLTISDDNFVKLVMGKLNQQQAFLMRKLKISGSMGMAMKLQPILESARPQAKL
jgi:putative sterol carrier protein